MAELPTASPASGSAVPAETPATVRLEVRVGSGPATTYPLSDAGFLIGTVPGCDLRLPGAHLPPLLCLIARVATGLTLRQLGSTQSLLINGQPVTGAALRDGDNIAVGGAEILVRVEAGSAPVHRAPRLHPPPEVATELEAAREAFRRQVLQFREEVLRYQREREQADAAAARRQSELDLRERRLEEQTSDLEQDRVAWYQRREEIERECRRQEAEIVARSTTRPSSDQQLADASDLEDREQALARRVEELSARQAELERREAEVESQRQEITTVRQELAEIRRQLYERYRERRDRLAGLQEAVNVAAKKVQERKRQADEEMRLLAARRREDEQRRAEVDAQAAALEQERRRLDAECGALDARQEELHQELADRLAQCKAKEEEEAARRADLERETAQHREDLVRLDRLRHALEERERGLADRDREHEERVERLRRDTQDLEEQALQLDEWHTKLVAVGERLAKQKAEQDAVGHQLAARAAALEGQQATLAALRTRLERMRAEVRAEEQEVAGQRERYEADESEIKRRLEEAARLRAEAEEEKLLHERERQRMAQRAAEMEAAVAQLRQAQEKAREEEAQLSGRAVALDEAAEKHAEQSALLQARAEQLDQLQRRLEADREALRERTAALAQAEQMRETLQEQLRRRSEELAARQKALAEHEAKRDAVLQEVEAQRASLADERREAEEALATVRAELELRAQALATRATELDRQQEQQKRIDEKLRETGRAVADQRKALLASRNEAEAIQLRAESAASQERAVLEELRREALALKQQLPELELTAGTALERLTHAREQLREHLAEVHAYARQCEEELEGLRGQVQAEADRLQQQEGALRRAQDEQRLAAAAFRQQLIAWQGQVAEMKRLLAQDQTRLQLQQDQVQERARQVESDTQRLAERAEELQERERAVVERRGEVDRHLIDMREWYCRKLRELAGVGPASRPSAPPVPGQRDILSLTGDVDPADGKLGELLRSLGLVEADTLTALLVEARRQRRSLRQVLLASGAVTLYQMALIEAGNLDALVLGPVRVVDRLRATAHETVYRVYDPRRGQEAVLRVLGEAEMQDAVRPDEFRQRFVQAALPHPNLAATLEVLEVGGRPAALQEWLTGLPSTEWAALAGAPGVWYRLVSQAAQGLAAAHEAGLLHGHLTAEHVLLTGEGVVKLCGFGEPHWLAFPPLAEPAEDPAADLMALGAIAAAWCGPIPKRKPVGKSKTFPDALMNVLERLTAQASEARYSRAAEVLEELDRARAEVPANPEAWERLLRQVREEGMPHALSRRTA